MIEIRTFEGDEQELSDFTLSIWRKWYAGKMPVPLWSPQYFRRELLCDGTRTYLVAAYDGKKIVGSHPMRPQRIWLRGAERDASWGSYLTVDPEYRRQGVARLMQEEQERRHRERGVAVDFGYLYVRTARSMGRKFWLNAPAGTTRVRNMGTWGRALDHRTVAQFEYYWTESWGARAFGLVQRPPKCPDLSGIRSYSSADLTACAELVRQRSLAVDLGYLWSDQELARFLQFEDLSRTLVAEHEGRVAGLVNYFRLGFLGRREMPVGVIDFVVLDRLPRAMQVRLLRATLVQMQSEGLKAAMYLRGSWHAGSALWAAGFFPLPPEYIYIGTKMGVEVPLQGVKTIHAIWR